MPKKSKPKCQACGGTGWLVSSNTWRERNKPYALEIMRCDSCEKFKGDLDAGQAFFRSPEGAQYHLSFIRIVKKDTSPIRIVKRDMSPLYWRSKKAT